MFKFQKAVACALVGSVMMLGGIGGCTKKPSSDELSKLEEAKAAAESSVKKLSDLRQERMSLEKGK